MGSSTRAENASIRERLPLLHLDTRELHHLRPFLGFLGDELGEVGWRAGKYFTAEFGHPRRHQRIGERRADLPIEPLDDLARRALGNTNAEEAGHHVARDNIANHWNVRQHRKRAFPVTPSARNAPDWICGTADPTASNIACTSPAISAECAAGVPR